ncbi:hypothetical protein [Anaplasma marginale]|nr:hypothetical protein [Anaplasma marginale]
MPGAVASGLRRYGSRSIELFVGNASNHGVTGTNSRNCVVL